MRPDVAQVVALCSHLNAFLRSEEERSPELTLLHPAFKTLCELRFIRVQPTGTEEIADGTSPWMRRQRKEDVVKVFLALDPVLELGKNSEEPWGVVTDGRRGLEVWHPTWKTRLKGYADPSPHRVVYAASRYPRWGLGSPIPIEAVGEKLDETFFGLQEALPFSTKLVAPELDVLSEEATPLMRDMSAKALSIIGQLNSNASKTLIAKLDLPTMQIVQGALETAKQALNLAAA